jgi:hypothetical protein
MYLVKMEGVDLEDSSDAELKRFKAQGAAPLPNPSESGYVVHDGARIWYSSSESVCPWFFFLADWGTAATGGSRFRRASNMATA